ncbi:MAG: ABC transporter permease, partial [Planctomycetota bacterium]
PVDTLKALDTDRMVPQVRELAVFVAELANSKDIAGLRPAIKPDALYAETRWDNNDRAGGPSVKRAGGGSAMADIPVRGAVVVVAPFQDGPWNAGDLNKTPPGYNHVLLSRTDVSGTFEVPVYFRPYYQASVLFSGAFDRPRTESVENLQPGQPERTRSRGILTGTTASQSMRAGATLRNTLITQFESRSMSFAGYGFNRRKLSTTAMRAMSTASFRPDRHLICELGNIVTVYAPYDADGLKVFNKAAIVLLNNTDTKAGHRGRGLPLADQFAHPSTPFTTANDLLNLEHYRLFDLLGKNHIKQPSLVRLWTEAHDLYQQSLAARTWLQKHGGNPDREAPTEELPEPYQATQREHLSEKCASDAAAAANLTRGAYEPTVGVMNDLVTAVVLLLLLAMPFAYALERLLIGTPHIYRQIGWFAGLFVLTFAVLYLVNPAFRIASTPVIIFLAFAIILLSCLVIFIMVRKLQTEIRRMQGLASTVHSADVSRLGTMLAAVNMGISTMRRRPLRTFLTAATVVLLTFTILTFASFGSRWGVRETYEGPMSGPPRILVRHQLLSPVARGTYDMLRGHFRGRAEVVPRYWVSPSAAEAQEATKTGESHDILAWVEDADEKTLMRAAVGLDPRDVEHQPGLARMFDPLALTEDERRINEQRRAEDREELTRQEIIARRLGDNGVFLTDAVREALKLRTDDVGRAIRLGQRRLSFAGVIRDEFGGHTMLEGTSPLPVNYQALAGATGQQTQDTGATTLVETQEASSAQFVHFNVDGVAVIPASVARIMSDRIVSLTLYPRESGDVGAIGHRTAQLAKLPTYAGQRGGVQRLLFTSLTEASGVRDLFIPVVLGGMIVFATMLGSVSDREREIYTFSSLGLAPPHVAGLFFAEASIYAVVGGMGGYLLGQGVARLLGWLSGLVEFDVPTMNYSSTNAIVTILIVMGTVMVSTIYPALKASRSANPGIQRQWRIPKPAGNLYDLMFPFTVSAYDITGVVSFLKEHFDNFQDASLGDFATTRCRIVRQKDNDMLGFEATVALAPFDLGVNQRFALLSRPSDIEGIDEVRILIYRLSGANGDWQRSNRTFINNLRKQLLIWRSLPQDVMDNYRQKTLQMWDELPVERIDPETIAQSASEMHASDDQEPAR